MRPDHLFSGTVADNQMDMAAKGRSRRGERHHHARLTEGQRSRNTAPGRQQEKAIGRLPVPAAFVVSHQHVS